jgi:CubicO group peptidase (beta-lactamase class C family)
MTDRRSALRALAATTIAPLLPACGTAPPRPDTFGRGGHDAAIKWLGALIRRKMDDAGIAGLSIALLDGQRLIHAEGFGVADKAAGRPATAHTRYRAGSISKVFTVAAAMQMVEAGTLDLDAPLTDVLPDFSIRTRGPAVAAITPRMLMTHHSGLPSDRIEGMWRDNPLHFTSLVTAMHDEYRAFPPDLIHAYSNLGFSLLGAAIERIAGMPFERHMRERLLLPLGMENSVFDTRPPGDTQAYDAQGHAGNEPALRDSPAGGLNTSAPELLQLARMIFAQGDMAGGRVLGPASLAEMARPQNAGCALDADLRVGLGWHFAPDAVRGGGPVLSHDGGTLHHHSALMLLPEHRLAVAVLSNSANAARLVNRLAGTALGLLLEVKTGIRQPTGPIPAQADPRFPPARPEAIAGFYDTPTGFAEIRRDGDRLQLRIGDRQLDVRPRPDGYLGLEYRILGLFPVSIGPLGELAFTLASISGREVLLARQSGGFFVAGERMAAVPVPEAWRARLGTYRYVGGDAFLAGRIGVTELALEDGFLVAVSTAAEGIQKLALAPVGDDEAVIRGLGRGRGDTVHVRAGHDGERLHYAGMVFQRATGAAAS